MKRVLVLFATLAVLIAAVFPTAGAAARAADGSTYALITAPDASLLREATEPSIENTYFTLPKTYFVLLVQPDYSESHHKVRYRDTVGFVRKSDVELVDYTPASVYPPTVTLKINADAESVRLRSRPDHLSSEVVYNIPSNAAKIEYYGTAKGTDMISGVGGKWYYVKISPSAESVLKGYVNASYVLLESEIPAENDTSAVITPSTNPNGDAQSPDANGSVSDPETDDKESTIRLIGILALCVPAVAIVILIFARPKRKKKAERAEKYSS